MVSAARTSEPQIEEEPLVYVSMGNSLTLMLIPNDEWAEPFQTAAGIRGNDPSDCGGDDNQECLREVIDSYKQFVDQIFEELAAIVDPAQTVVRAQDFYQFGTSELSEETFAVTNPYWREAQEYVEQVAGQYGIPVAQVFDDFMGTDGSYIDLVAEGLVEPDDIHPTAQGAERMATLMHDLGYELAYQPDRHEAVFDFEQNTLCDWFSADQMESIVAEAMERAGVDIEVELFSTSGECRMLFVDEAIWDTPGWRTQSDGGLGITLTPVVNDPRGGGYRSTGPADFERHAQLDDDVSVGNRSSGFAYSPGLQAQLLVEGHDDEVLFLGVGVEGKTLGEVTMTQQEDFALSVADIMLAEMNWTD